MKKSISFILSLIMLAAVLMSGCATAGTQEAGDQTDASVEPEYTITVGTYNTSTGPDGVSMERFKEYVEEASAGRIEVHVYHNSQLGDTNAQIEGVMMGSQDIFLTNIDLLAPWAPEMNILSSYYLFRDGDHLVKFLQSDLFQPAIEKLADNNVMLLNNTWNFIQGPYRVLVSIKPFTSIEDAKGMRHRVPDINMQIKSWQAFGATTIQVAFAEVYLALEQGMIDSHETPLNVVRENSYCEVCKYMTKVDTFPQRYQMIMNKSRFDSFPEDIQQILFDGSTAAGEAYSEVVQKAADEDIDYLIETYGITWVEDIDLEPFREAAKSVQEEMEAAGTFAEGTFEKIRALE